MRPDSPAFLHQASEKRRNPSSCCQNSRESSQHPRRLQGRKMIIFRPHLSTRGVSDRLQPTPKGRPHQGNAETYSRIHGAVAHIPSKRDLAGTDSMRDISFTNKVANLLQNRNLRTSTRGNFEGDEETSSKVPCPRCNKKTL